MNPGTVELDPTLPASFVGSDGRLELAIPTGAVSIGDIKAAGGRLSLRVQQIDPASGSNAGGSGKYSFGTFLIQVVDAAGHVSAHGLRKSIVAKLHYGNHENGIDLAHAYLVVNGGSPTDQSFNPDGSGKLLARGAAGVGPLSLSRTVLSTPQQTLTATVPASSPSIMASFNSNSPVASFAKPDIFNADLNAGALSASYPIDVPAGPGGLTPPVALSYTSSAVSEQHNPQGAAPWIGEGWNLALGSISWAEHNVAEGAGGNNWQDSWQLNDAFGTTAELIPPSTTVSTYCDDSVNWPPTSTPVAWRTTPDAHARVIEYGGPNRLSCPAGSQTYIPPCFRVFLPNGLIEEFGCTADSLQWYPWSNGADAIAQWLPDLIIDSKSGNQIHFTYRSDVASFTTSTGPQSYPRDTVLQTIEWDSPGCRNWAASCSGWGPLTRVNFVAGHAVTHPNGTSCGANGNLRCDDPVDLTGSGGVVNPRVQSTFVLNDIQVQVRASSSASWSTLRDYQLGYEQTGPTTVTDPVGGLAESSAGKLNLTQLIEIGADAGNVSQTALPARTFSYQTLTSYYTDEAKTPTPATNCGPAWNKGPSGTCILWSQSYAGNSSYLASASNGMGLSETFSWALARNNTHGVNGGGPSNTDPFYCTNATLPTQSAYPCDEVDSQSWSRPALTQEIGAVISQSQNGQGGAQTNTTVGSTTSYAYTLAPYTAQACSDCTQGFYWGNQKDGDYSDYYNSKFMGFTQVTVTRPDGGVESHKYHATLGWGVYDCAQVSCTQDIPKPWPQGYQPTWCASTCHADPWWGQATVTALLGSPTIVNALHGHEYEADFYATDGSTLLRKTLTTFAYPASSPNVCPPSGVTGSPANGHGNWNGQLVSELDPSNPVGVCDLMVALTADVVADGSGAAAVPQKTMSYAYDGYGRVTSETITSNDGGAAGSATTIVHKPTYIYNDAVTSSSTSATGHYLIDFEASNDTEDGSGNRTSCSYTSYDGGIWSNGPQSGLIYGDPTRLTRYTDCTKLDSPHAISTTYAYDTSANRIASSDPDANGGVSGHAGCTPNVGIFVNGSASPWSRCTAYDSTFQALPVSDTNALSQIGSTGYRSPSSGTAGDGYGMWPLSTTDANGQVTSRSYDALGRTTSQTLPGEGAGLATSTNSYANWCSGSGPQSPCIEVDHNQRLGSATGGTLVPLPATRICDTRAGSGTLCAGHTIAANTTLNVQVGGQGGIPSSGVAAIVVNVAVTNTTGSGVLVVYPAGVSQPPTSNINWASGQTITNLVQVPVGTNGQVAFSVFGSAADLIVDVQGYVPQNWSGAAGLMNPLRPSSRICDTRAGSGTPCAGRTIAGGGTLNVQMTGQGGIPTSGVSAVVVNVAVTNTTTSGVLTVYPAGAPRPATTNLNWSLGQTVSNRVVVPIGSGGQIALTNLASGSADAVVDAYAWATDGSNAAASGTVYYSLTPSRICDTRSGNSTTCSTHTIGGGSTLVVQAAGIGGVPSMGGQSAPQAVHVNVAALNPTAAGALTIYPNGTTRPPTSDLNYAAQQTIANLDIVATLGTDGNLAIYNSSSGSLDVLVDLAGYYAPGTSGMVTTRSFYDGWGNLVETRAAAPGGKDAVRYLVYDVSNRLWKQSVAYFATAYAGPAGSAAYSIPDSTLKITQNSYDGLGRLVSTTDPLSNTTTNGISVVCNAQGTGDTACYEQTLTIDANNHQKGGLVDSLGRREYVQLFTGNTPATYAPYATTKYTYDPNGALAQILQPDGSSKTTFTLDAAGRKTAMSDPDLGSTSYQYDPNGNTTQSTDARGGAGTIYAAYDGLDRPLWRNTTNNSIGAYQTYTYDVNATYPIGRLTSETFTGGPTNSLSGSYTYNYDPRGQETSASLTVGGTQYPVQTSFDDAGNTLTQTYPTGEVVTTGYGAQGWLNSVSTSQGNTTLLNNATYSQGANQFGGPSQQVTGATSGGIYQYTATYDALLRPVYALVANGGSKLFEQSRTFDGSNNVTATSTTLPSGIDNQAFCYDEQNRLTWAGNSGTPQCGGSIPPNTLSGDQAYSQANTYDTLGRLTSGPLGSYSYSDPAHLHAATAIGSTWTAAYDAAGNMSCRAPSVGSACSGTQTGAQLSYDADGSMAAWQDRPSSPTVSDGFLYDNQGNRVEQQVTQGGTTTTTVYVGNLEQVKAAGSTISTTTFYYAGAARIAVGVDGTISYLASDGLGSADVALNSTGSATASLLYGPYGVVRYSQGTMPTDYGFTGQHSDVATGLDYYASRYYDPVAGQFTSGDSILPGDGYDILGLSRYAYVEGNPVDRVDPSGHCWPWCTAAIGAGIGAGISIATQVVASVQHHHSVGYALNHLDVAEIAKSALIGAAVGVGGPETLAGGLAARVAVGAASGAAGQVGDNLLHGRHWSNGVAESAAIGAASVGVFAGGSAGVRALLRADERAAAGDASRVIGSSCGLSFSADTQVATPDGPRPIASIKVGDKVLAYDPTTKQISAESIAQVFLNQDSDRVDVTLEASKTMEPAISHRPGGRSSPSHIVRTAETIRTTANHPWLTTDRGWIEAGALRLGERVQLANGQTARVISVKAIVGSGIMYDLGLAQVHTFAVGGSWYVVHNCGSGVGGRLRDRLGRFMADPSKPQTEVSDGVHGNSRASLRTTFLYERRLEGQFEKWGISSDPGGRYASKFMRGRSMRLLAEGSRSEMLDMERSLVQLDPGPANYEPWAPHHGRLE